MGTVMTSERETEATERPIGRGEVVVGMPSVVRNAAFQKVVFAVQQTTHVEASCISESTRLKDDLAFGRFRRNKFALCLEDIFDLELSNDVMERFTTVADVVSYFSWRYFRDVEHPAIRAAA